MSKEPEDLGIKMAVNDEHKAWLEAKEQLEKDTANYKRTIELNEAMLKFIEKKIETFK